MQELLKLAVHPPLPGDVLRLKPALYQALLRVRKMEI